MNEEQDLGLMYNRVMPKESQVKNEEQDPGSTLPCIVLHHRVPLRGLSLL